MSPGGKWSHHTAEPQHFSLILRKKTPHIYGFQVFKTYNKIQFNLNLPRSLHLHHPPKLHAASHTIEPQPFGPGASPSSIILKVARRGRSLGDLRFLRADSVPGAAGQWWLMGGVTAGHRAHPGEHVSSLAPAGHRYSLYSSDGAERGCVHRGSLDARRNGRRVKVLWFLLTAVQFWEASDLESRADTHHWLHDTYKQRHWRCCCNTVTRQQETSHADHWHHIVIEIWVSISLLFSFLHVSQFLSSCFFFVCQTDLTPFQTAERASSAAFSSSTYSRSATLLYSSSSFPATVPSPPSPWCSTPPFSRHLSHCFLPRGPNLSPPFSFCNVVPSFSITEFTIVLLPSLRPLHISAPSLLHSPLNSSSIFIEFTFPFSPLTGLVPPRQTGVHFTHYLFPCFVILPSSSGHH